MHRASVYISALLPFLPVTVSHDCGQPEIDARDITGCTTVLHMKNLGHQGAVWLGDALHHNPHLEYLDLHHTFVGNDDAIAIANGLHNNTFLKRLAMHNNRITDEGASAIGAALAHNHALEFMSLSSNGIGDAGAIAIAAGLRDNRALRRLDLYFNLIGDDGAVAFANALESNKHLRTLHLDTNSVGDRGGLALCHALAPPPPPPRGLSAVLASTRDYAPPPKVFAELTLMYNHLTNDAAEACMDAAVRCTSLHKLELSHNHAVDGESKERLIGQHKQMMAERLKLATWIVDHELLGADHWHSHDGPPLASAYAPVVAALRLHTSDGLLALRHEDADTLAVRAELQSIQNATQRMRLVQAVLKSVPGATNHEEL